MGLVKPHNPNMPNPRCLGALRFPASQGRRLCALKLVVVRFYTGGAAIGTVSPRLAVAACSRWQHLSGKVVARCFWAAGIGI
jgi:hypothetical protein